METFIATIILWPSNWAPEGWYMCQGQLLQIAEYQALFSLLGTQFGGDGKTTFALPNLKSTFTGINYIIAWQGIYPNKP